MDDNTLRKRFQRYSHSSAVFTTLATKYIASYSIDPETLVKKLGSFKGPLMKIGQLLAMVPDLLPTPYAEALNSLQSQAPPMGELFVKRRMKSELGPNWESCFRSFDLKPFAAASIGQVHQAESLEGDLLACKLQYPNMEGIIQADLSQFRFLLSLYDKGGGALKTDQFLEEIQHHLCEEIKYKKEARNLLIFQSIFRDHPQITVPAVFSHLSTERLLTMSYTKGFSLQDFSQVSFELRNQASKNLFFAWYYPLHAHGYLHGDPHAGNYLFSEEGDVSLLDFGCVRQFSSSFIQGIQYLYEALKTNNQELLIHAYEQWGFKGLTKDLIDILTLWAKFLYGPILENRVRPISEDYNGVEGKLIAKEVLRRIKMHGRLTLPREFILMDRVTVGMGSAFIKLRAKLNWHHLFEEILIQSESSNESKSTISKEVQNNINHRKGNKG